MAAPGPDPGWQVLHVHPHAPAKPALGAPCNGCGLCCLAEPCPLGVLASRRRRGACAALRWDAAARQYRCGLVAAPAEWLGPRWRWLAPLLRPLARRWISAGRGCDAAVTVERPPEY